jgi:hypothetical protein
LFTHQDRLQFTMYWDPFELNLTTQAWRQLRPNFNNNTKSLTLSTFLIGKHCLQSPTLTLILQDKPQKSSDKERPGKTTVASWTFTMCYLCSLSTTTFKTGIVINSCHTLGNQYAETWDNSPWTTQSVDDKNLRPSLLTAPGQHHQSHWWAAAQRDPPHHHHQATTSGSAILRWDSHRSPGAETTKLE